MPRKHPNEFSWVDPAIAELRNDPASVLDEVTDLIKQFNGTATEDLDQGRIKSVVGRLTEIFFFLPYEVREPQIIWRVRSSRRGQLFRHTGDLSYPPAGAVPAGRMNFSSNQIFYGASSPETAMAEHHIAEGSYFHLTKYKSRPGQSFYVHIIGDIDSLRRRSKTVLDIPTFANVYEYALQQLRPEVKLAVQLVDAFFVDRLSRKGSEAEYRVTAAIAAELLQSDKLSGLLFPSVEHAGGYNWALKPLCYDNHILPVETSAQLTLNAYGYGAYKTARWGPAIITQFPGDILWPDVPAIREFSGGFD